MIFKFISRMIFASTLVLLAVFVIRQQIESAFLSNPVINGVIVGVLLLGCVLAYVQVVRLGKEWRWVETARDNMYLRNQGEDIELVPSTPPGRFLSGKPVLLAPLANLLEERHKNYADMRLSPASVRHMLDSVSLRLEENSELLRYFVGLLVFIGLLGTFWGLMQTLDSIGGVIQASDFQQQSLLDSIDGIREGLSSPLSGMSTAFSSSLFGLAGSLFLGLLSLFSNQAQNRFYNEIEEWFSSITRLGSHVGTEGGDQPLYTQSLLEHTADTLDKLSLHLQHSSEQQKRIAEQMSQLSETMAQTVNNNDQSQILRQILLSHQRLEASLHQDRQTMTEQLRDELRLLGRLLSASHKADDNISDSH